MFYRNWFGRAIELWQTWRYGIPDNQLRGVELRTFRSESYSRLTKLGSTAKKGALTLPPSVSYHPTAKEALGANVGTDSPDASEYLGVECLEESSETMSPMEGSESWEEGPSFAFLLRFANRALPEEYHFREGDFSQFLELCEDGVVFCFLLNRAVMPDMVDIRALNVPSPEGPLSFEEKCQNHILCLNSLAAVSHIPQQRLDPTQLAKGEPSCCVEHLCRIVRAATIARLDAHRSPELRALQGDEEDIFNFLQLTPQELLLRWVHFTLAEGDTADVDEEGASVLADPVILLKLQNRLHPGLFTPLEYGLRNCVRKSEKMCV